VSVRLAVTAALTGGDTCLRLTVRQEGEHFWHYNLPRIPGNGRRLAFGGVTGTDYMAALRRAAERCAEGFQPSDVERGLLDMLAKGET
jgi:hypothetical protein